MPHVKKMFFGCTVSSRHLTEKVLEFQSDFFKDLFSVFNFSGSLLSILHSIVVSIPACHAGGWAAIPHRGGLF